MYLVAHFVLFLSCLVAYFPFGVCVGAATCERSYIDDVGMFLSCLSLSCIVFHVSLECAL